MKTSMMSAKKSREFFLRNLRTLFTTIFICTLCAVTVFAAGSDTTDGTAALDKAKQLLATAAQAGGGLWAVWGLVQMGMAIKDHNGPGIGGAVWQIVGGALILAAGSIISGLKLDMTLPT